MPRALILGGTGGIGLAAARRLLAAGWQVDLNGRDLSRLPGDVVADGARFFAADRGDAAGLGRTVGAGADLLIDCVCYTAADAASLLPFLPSVNSTVMLSSKAVYVDAAGRHANSKPGPRFAGPVPESQPTVAPSDAAPDSAVPDSAAGYGAHKVAAEQVLLDSGAPVSVLRPSKVHGAGLRRPREWVFLKRVLDRRPAVLLAHHGAGQDHTCAAAP